MAMRNVCRSQANVFRAFHMKINDDERSFEKVVLFSRWKLSGGNAYFIYEFSPGITSSRLSPAAWRYICATILTFGDESISELRAKGTRFSLDGPFHGSFEKFWVNGK